MSRPCRLSVSALILVGCASLAVAEDWPQWRGPNRDDVSQEQGLLKAWPDGGPQRVWLSKDAGLGYSGFSVVGDTLYTMGAKGDEEHLIAINVTDGATRWSVPIGSMLENRWGDGPRGTPTVDGDRLYALTGNGTLACVRASDGDVLWKVEMRDLGGGKPNWGYCESVLIDGDRVVCTPGGKKGAIAALNKATGDVIWQSKDFTDGAQYASIVVAEYGGKRQYVQLTQQSLVGIDAASGDLLWKTDFPGRTAVIPTPIVVGDLVYVSAGYGAGCKLVKITSQSEPEEVYANKNMTNHHGGVVLVGDHLYGYSDGKGWVCQDFKTGEMVWNERSELGKGCLTYADGKLYLLDEKTGDVALIDATPDSWVEHGRFTLQPQTEQRSPSGRIWTHPVVANGRLYLRDQELLFSFDVKGE